MHFIGVLEKALGREAKKNFLPLQPGDVPATFADVTISSPTWALRPPRRSRRALPASLNGIAATMVRKAPIAIAEAR